LIKKNLEKNGLKTDYEEGRLQPAPAGHPQLAAPLFLSPHDILKKRIREKNHIEIHEKILRKKWPWLRQTMKKGNCSQPQLANPSWPPPDPVSP
jgi:hypothetical protein